MCPLFHCVNVQIMQSVSERVVVTRDASGSYEREHIEETKPRIYLNRRNLMNTSPCRNPIGASKTKYVVCEVTQLR